IAAGLWACTFVSVGYLAGQASEAILGDLASKFRFVMLGIFAALVLAVTVTIYVRRRRADREKKP
ncbi:MAG: DedA family protein, partial [Acidobacteriota bacterium]